MELDKYSNPVFTSEDILEYIYQDCTLSPKDLVIVSDSNALDYSNLEQETGATFIYRFNDVSIEKYDQTLQDLWMMPEIYRHLDIKKIVLETCTTDEEIIRAREELTEFESRSMLNLLRWLKYFVDTCTEKNVLWGVGRGSSVASFVLYKLGVHMINPIKYNLDWREFLR